MARNGLLFHTTNARCLKGHERRTIGVSHHRPADRVGLFSPVRERRVPD